MVTISRECPFRAQSNQTTVARNYARDTIAQSHARLTTLTIIRRYSRLIFHTYIFFIPLEESYSNVNSTRMSTHINKNNNNTKKDKQMKMKVCVENSYTIFKKTQKTTTTHIHTQTYTESFIEVLFLNYINYFNDALNTFLLTVISAS